MRNRLLAVLTLACLVGCADDGAAATASDDGSSTGVDPTTTGTVTGSSGSTGVDPEPLVADAGMSRYALVGEEVVLDGSASTGAVTYHWSLGDGSAPVDPGPDPIATVTYDTPGRYRPVLSVFDADGASRTDQVTITVTLPAIHTPRHASTIARRDDDAEAWVVSPDADVLTVIGRDREGFAVLERWPTCATPRTIAPSGGGAEVAIACQGDDAVALLDPATGELRRVDLPRASRPYGVVATDDRVFVTLQATGEVAEIDPSPATPVVVATHPAVPDARGIAVLPDGRLAVTRWRSPDDEAAIALLDPAEGAVAPSPLAFDDRESSDTEAGGVPSYLDQVLVSPTGTRAAVPSLQANIAQGLFVGDEPLTFHTTLRGVVSSLDLTGSDPVETLEQRKHFDDRGFMAAGVHSSRGDYLFLAARGSRTIERLDTFNGAQSGVLIDVGYAPSGLALTSDDRFLLVDAALSREVVVYDVADFGVATEVARLATLAQEPLPPTVLRGKQLFNDSFDPRLAQDSYIACAHCHLDGESDHRVWDFTDRGEGLRNTISLLGRGGIDQGPIHWSANFDEVQDFEHDIRGPFGGLGLMDDDDWATHDDTLGEPKAGLSEDLDALAAYVESLTTYPRSPERDDAGALTASAEAGQAIFESPQTGCTTCHTGPALTDSAFDVGGEPILHDVGTLSAGSGQRLGDTLLGIDTPTLHGLWNGAPYLHDGSAATLLDVLTTRNPSDQHGTTSGLSAGELADLVAYLRSLEG